MMNIPRHRGYRPNSLANRDNYGLTPEQLEQRKEAAAAAARDAVIHEAVILYFDELEERKEAAFAAARNIVRNK
jgi:hypothetical protein